MSATNAPQSRRTPAAMQAAGTAVAAEPVYPSIIARRSGQVLSGLAVLFLAFDAGMKLLRVPEAVSGTVELGYPAAAILPIGLVQAVCLMVYLIPRTSVLGAILWTGYLGGAVATHVRVENPLFSHTLFPVYVGILLWAGLWLRDQRLRGIFPATQADQQSN